MPDIRSELPAAALPDLEIELVINLLEHTAEGVHPDLRAILSEPDADKLADDILRDEIHRRRA
jgi:hypothetical protein